MFEAFHNSSVAARRPVWQVAWAHPKFGVLLASCSYDGKVIIFREAPQGQWTPIHEHRAHESSVNSVSWAPHEYGLILGCASADGSVTILTHQDDDTWLTEPVEDGSRLGCNAISWAPVAAASAQELAPMRFVTGSCDNHVRVWERNEEGKWVLQGGQPISTGFDVHKDWVRDVAWAPSTGLPSKMIASCGEDRLVFIWTFNDETQAWVPKPLKEEPFAAPVWRVSWSVTGNLLAVSCGDHKVSLWKQALTGDWEMVSEMSENAEMKG